MSIEKVQKQYHGSSCRCPKSPTPGFFLIPFKSFFRSVSPGNKHDFHRPKGINMGPSNGGIETQHLRLVGWLEKNKKIYSYQMVVFHGDLFSMVEIRKKSQKTKQLPNFVVPGFLGLRRLWWTILYEPMAGHPGKVAGGRWLIAFWFYRQPKPTPKRAASTPWKFNIDPQILPSQRERIVFEPSFFRGFCC